MSCTQTCHHPKRHYSFVFLNTPKSIQSAQKHCKSQNKGALASDLKKNDYDTIKSCCQIPQGKYYWIGLINDNTCKNSGGNQPPTPYHWIGQTNCVNAAPPGLTYQPNNNVCKAVAFNVANTGGNPQFSYCNDLLPFICKVSRRKTTTKARTTTTTNKRTTRPALPYTTSQNRAMTTSQVYVSRISTNSAMISKATTFNQNDGTASVLTGTGNAAEIAGSVLGSLVIILLLLMLLWRYKKRHNRKLHKQFGPKNKNISPEINGNRTDEADPSSLYHNIAPRSFAHESDNLSRKHIYDCPYSTVNEHVAANQNINPNGCENLHPSSLYYNTTLSSLVHKSRNLSRKDFSDGRRSTLKEEEEAAYQTIKPSG